MTKWHKFLLLDVDGVLNAICNDEHLPAEFTDWQTVKSSPESGGFTLRLSKQMGEELLSLGAQMRWLTTWTEKEDFANGDVGALLGFPHLEPITTVQAKGFLASWKVASFRNFWNNLPEHSLVAWVDDDMQDFLDELQPHVRVGNQLPFNNEWAKLLTVTPDTSTGISRAQIRELREFFETE